MKKSRFTDPQIMSVLKQAGCLWLSCAVSTAYRQRRSTSARRFSPYDINTVATVTTTRVSTFPSTSNRISGMTENGSTLRTYTYDGGGNIRHDSFGLTWRITLKEAGTYSRTSVTSSPSLRMVPPQLGQVQAGS
jgi:hypothetical protein